MLLNILTWWQALSGAEQIFWSIGLISNLLFALYIGIQVLGHDADLDTEVDDIDGLDTGEIQFTVLSLRSLLAFGMFLGYTGLTVLHAGFGLITAVCLGSLAGLLAAWLAFKLIRFLLKMQSSGTLILENSVGATGKVHLTLPANAASTGKVMVTLQGALREMDAVSEGETIQTGTSILVTEVLDNGNLVVIPYKE